MLSLITVLRLFQMIGASRLDKTEILELAVDELRHCVTFSQPTPPCKYTDLLNYLHYLVLLDESRR